MRKKIMVLMIVLFTVPTVQAAEPDRTDAFWTGLLNKLQKVTPTRKSTTTTAVGGVRSAKNDEAADIYWKGKEKSLEASEEEVAAFTAAVDSGTKGNRLAALKLFEDFLRDYPESPLRPDALQAVDRLKGDEPVPSTTTPPPQAPQ